MSVAFPFASVSAVRLPAWTVAPSSRVPRPSSSYAVTRAETVPPPSSRTRRPSVRWQPPAAEHAVEPRHPHAPLDPAAAERAARVGRARRALAVADLVDPARVAAVLVVADRAHEQARRVARAGEVAQPELRHLAPHERGQRRRARHAAAMVTRARARARRADGLALRRRRRGRRRAGRTAALPLRAAPPPPRVRGRRRSQVAARVTSA